MMGFLSLPMLVALSLPEIIGAIASAVGAILGLATIFTFVWKRMLKSIKNEIIVELKIERDKDQAQYAKDRVESNAVIEYIRAAILESYKHDIRAIYYYLRDTGKLSDADKSYVDKIAPIYFALGGNSDIHAKVNAINAVYERRTQAAFDKAQAESGSEETATAMRELNTGIDRANARKKKVTKSIIEEDDEDEDEDEDNRKE